MPSYVVTGASRGIGLEFVRQLAEIPENQVFALVRNRATALDVPSSPLKVDLPNVHVIEADVTNYKAMKSAAEKVAEVTGGSLDVLINNAAALAGENDWRTLLDFEGEDELLEKEFDHTFKVNIMGVIYGINSFLPLLRKGLAKKIVTMSSEGGLVDFVVERNLTEMVAYGASKAAVNMIVTKYALKLRDEGFICVAVSPGLINTTGTRTLPSKTAEWVMNFIDSRGKISSPNTKALTMLTPETGVNRLLKLISEASINDNGAFLRIEF